MLVDRIELEKYLETQFNAISRNKKRTKSDIYLKLEENYNIPIALSTDIFSSRIKLNDIKSDFILFAILDEIKAAKKELNTYFTENEIKTYKKTKYETNDIKFPLSFNVVQVSSDQWIGSIDFKDVMKLRTASLINYNKNTQRTLTRKIKGGVESFVITINRKAIKSIKTSFNNNIYIPDTITLNIQEDDDKADFYYDEKTNKLIINDISAFDIIDGYHRYFAFSQLYDLDNDMSYPMEIRITNFGEDKANQFIYQQDQKTKMKKSDSNTFNKYNAGNQIVDRLNTDASFDMQGQILKNGGKIDYGKFALFINGVYFDNKTSVGKKEIINATKELKQGINEFVEEYDIYLDKKWDYKEIAIIISGIRHKHKPEEIIKHINDNTYNWKDLFDNDGRMKKSANDLLKGE